ncbi:UDP-N-acetylmuramate--alanine ligase [Dyadobacter jejuensis]|uniref:UDP-N-acetylmuramate--L-alanine ligase n=1 Tax=Dyadobacter jejuensis TaxID=1082580 RepID=A0A316ART1_9BACT|nr:UDP-N-acetylmuramate--L-alanine ligase [Dyadobacter jejuensis]PWJ60141.1 UDP-N-acetylmuramate--alanine ligase [Dyadobacter jejuensis]
MMKYKNIYFVGIGGIGMSALARWFNTNGYRVAGYDKTATPLIGALESEGIEVTIEDTIESIPASFLSDSQETLVVYTPAIPVRHVQMNYFKEQNYMILKRSQVLGMLAGNMRTVGVAGTHGKTTTSSMIAHMLRSAGVNSTAFLGGITQNYGSNMLMNERTDRLQDVVCVVEADEFDRSFLTLFPEVAVVTSTDADHLDIYGKHEEMLVSFADFVGQIEPEGLFIMRFGLPLASASKASIWTYSLQDGDIHTANLRIENARFVFDLIYPEGVIAEVSMRVPGYHNIENALATAAVGLYLQLPPHEIKSALESYKGVKRRFEYHIEREDLVYIDDYAHHPTEITALLNSVRALYPNRKLTVVFQPHLFTRTRDFIDGFAESLSNVDQLILLDIYPAREEPIEGVNSEWLLSKVKIENKVLVTKSELLNNLNANELELLVTLGAGDIDSLVRPIQNLLGKPLTK